jgi:thioredoxin reductase (NADPH)
MNQTDPPLDCIVVGGGPAGLLAAIYLKRFHREVRVIDAGSSRTRYIRTSSNCPGFPGGVSGGELMTRLRGQTEALSIEIVAARVTATLRGDDDVFRVESEAGHWRARCVIAACGVVDRLPAWPDIEGAIRDGVVRLCAICDAYEVDQRRLAVYGTADECIPHACFLRTYSTHVAAICPPGPPPSDEHLARAVAEGVDVMFADEAECRVQGREFIVAPTTSAPRSFDSVYVSLGATANTGWLQPVGIETEANGEVKVDAAGRTNVPGVYAIGDVVSALNQISVAFGHAAITATHIHNHLPPNHR